MFRVAKWMTGQGDSLPDDRGVEAIVSYINEYWQH